MISSLLFALSAACLAAMFLPQRPSRPRQQLETYYVCGLESFPHSENEAVSSAMAGATRG